MTCLLVYCCAQQIVENFNEGLVSLYGSYIDTMKSLVWFLNIQCVLCIVIVYYYIISITANFTIYGLQQIYFYLFSLSFFEIPVVLESWIDVFAIF